MNIADVCARLAAIEKELTVEVDGLGEVTITRAYQLLADKDGPELPCFMHTWNLEPLSIASQSPNGSRQQLYTVGIQAFMADVQDGSEQWSRVATAFHLAFIDALARNLMLGDGQTQIDNLRGGNEGTTLAALTWGDHQYIGLDYLLDVRIVDTVLVGP